ncbi:iron complex outermembrane recepter protein [Nannocystis exedens]|uniref:Iron complex outermembrane recepter protein n=1 Tax=Nannocystis exedens TaxID=54 RepID=A0A1I1V5S0_9BACT|nr:TonB-dependent receptor [Nannocystis exedens]PCC72253.1 putative TonB-dependent receptor precursor [Nannocystis exedens]SFD76443.1 iron complex outermembrane recepter protein [Nannocystis exedens]
MAAELVALLLHLSLSEPAAPPPAPEQPAPAAGCAVAWVATVVESGTGEGLADARLELRAPGRSAPIQARTDEQGRVRVDGLCAGEMQVVAEVPEHAPGRLKVALSGSTTSSRIELEALHPRHSGHVIAVNVHTERPTGVSTSQSLAGAELARTRGQGLADALSGMSGVATLRGTAGGMSKPMIRGHVGRRNLIVVDGIRHEGQDWGIDHAPEVDPNVADRITVVKGAGTTRFGAKAIGGVVLLDSRPLPQRPSVRSEIGTVGYSNPLGGGGSARIDWAPARARGFAIRVEGNASRHRAVVTPTYPLDNTGAATWNAGTQLGYASDAVDFGVGYRVMRAVGGICTCLRISSPEDFDKSIARSRPIGAELYRADFEIERAKQEIWHHLAFARARVGLGRAGELHALYSFQFNDRKEYDVVRKSVEGPQLTFGLATHAAEVRYEHARLQLGQWSLVGTVGATFSHQTNRFTSSSTLIPDYRQASWAVYDIERFVHERVELELGARYEGLHRTADLRERDFLGQQAGGRLDPTTCRASGDGGTCERGFHTASATLGALVRPFGRAPEFTWRTQLNSSARIPSIDEQFMNGAAPSFPILGVGSSKLGVERSWGGESTLQYDGDWLLVEAAGHAAYIDDYIYFVPQRQNGQCGFLSCTARGPLPVFAFTPVDAFFGGGELRFDLRAPRLPFGLAGSASWVRALDLQTGAPLAFIPADRYWLAGRYYFPDTRVSGRGYIEVNTTIVARQRRFPEDVDFSPPPPAYALLGAGAGVEFMSERRLFRLSLIGTNLTNTRYRDYTSLLRYFADEAGWGLQLRFAVDFDVPLDERPRR